MDYNALAETLKQNGLTPEQVEAALSAVKALPSANVPGGVPVPEESEPAEPEETEEDAPEEEPVPEPEENEEESEPLPFREPAEGDEEEEGEEDNSEPLPEPEPEEEPEFTFVLVPSENEEGEPEPEEEEPFEIPEGFKPAPVSLGDVHEATKALRSWTENSLGGRKESPRRDAPKLCARLASQASIVRTRKTEHSRKRLLVAVDVSYSCRFYAGFYIGIALACAKVDKRIAVLIHSNGIPLSLVVDGQERNLRGLVSWGTKSYNCWNGKGVDPWNSSSQANLSKEQDPGSRLAKVAMGPNAYVTIFPLNCPGTRMAGGATLDQKRFWGILQGLNLQGVLYLGDGDGIDLINHLSEQINVVWIDHTNNVDLVKVPVRNIREKGVIYRPDCSDKAKIWKAIKSLPVR